MCVCLVVLWGDLSIMIGWWIGWFEGGSGMVVSVMGCVVVMLLLWVF